MTRRNLFANEAAIDGGPDPQVEQGLQLLANINLAIGKLAGKLDQERADRIKLAQSIHPLNNISCPPITTANGTADYPNLLGPREGKTWEVRLMGAQTFTGGTVNVYLNSIADQNIVAPFSSAGIIAFGGGVLLINHGQRLIVSAVNVTGNVTFSLNVIEIDTEWVGAYLL